MCWQQPRTLGELSDVQRDALGLDAALVRVARGSCAIELAIGRTLDRLFRGDRLLQLCYSCEADYARERLGIPPRTMYLWLRLARGLEDRPLLERAVVSRTTSTGSTSGTQRSPAGPASGSTGGSGPGTRCRSRSGSPAATTTSGGRTRRRGPAARVS